MNPYSIKRKRYKVYGDPGSSKDVPRNTAWRYEYGVSSKNAHGATSLDQSRDPPDCSSRSSSDYEHGAGNIIQPLKRNTQTACAPDPSRDPTDSSSRLSSADEHGAGNIIQLLESNTADAQDPSDSSSHSSSDGEHVAGNIIQPLKRNAQTATSAPDPSGDPTDSSSHSSSDTEDGAGYYRRPIEGNNEISDDNDGNDIDENDYFNTIDYGSNDLHEYTGSESEEEYNAEDIQDNANNNQADQDQLPLPPPFPDHHLLRRKLEGEYSEVIQDRVAVSRGEMLLNVQEFCRQHPLPLTCQEDLHALINSFFYKEIIPDSKYKLDKLFSDTNHIKYIFYCSKCYDNFGELDYKTVKIKVCPRCETENLVSDLTKAHYFVIFDFIKQFKLVLEDPAVAVQLTNPNECLDNGDVMKDIYDGQMYKEFVSSIDFTTDPYVISFTASTDGTPVFQSSTLSIWPIFVIVNEMPPKIRNDNVLLGGLWFGRKHPQMELFLGPFCDYVRNLSVNGFDLKILNEVRPYKAFLLALCADSGARGSIQGIHAHNGEYGCSWCLHPGEVEGGGSFARKFRQLPEEPASRTHEKMEIDCRALLQLTRNISHVNGVTGVTPLFRRPKFKVVEGLVLDILHWADFGVGRRMGCLWLGETKNQKTKAKEPQQPAENITKPAYYIGSEETKAVLSSRISKLRPPLEIRRRPRDFSQIHDYNAREWENMVLYFSVPIFKNILPERFLRHWTLFAQALYLLVQSEMSKNDLRAAGAFMKSYVNRVEALYGAKEMTYNMHISNHVEANVERWGPIHKLSTFVFENGNKILKSKIHAERGIPNQLIRSLNRDSSLRVLRTLASTPQASSFRSKIARKEVKKSFYIHSIQCMMPVPFSPSAEEAWLCRRESIDTTHFVQCGRIIQDNVCYSVDNGKSRTDNSYGFADGLIFKIRKIIASEREELVYLFVSRVRVSPYPLPRHDFPGSFTPFLFNVDLVEEGVVLISSTALKTICVNICIDCRFLKAQFIAVMANTSNTF